MTIDWSSYWMGVVTPLVIVAVIVGSFAAYFRLVRWLDDRFGIVFEAKFKRRVDEIGDYTLRRNIWWERSVGPVFFGGWYRDDIGPRFNRWIGLGSVHGPCVMGIRKVIRDA